jgi:MFS family permease
MEHRNEETLNNTEGKLESALDSYLKDKHLPVKLMAVLLFVGSLIGFAQNTSPAPFIPSMIGFFGLDSVQDQGLINLSMSIIFASTIPAQFIGTVIEEKFGTRLLFSLAMLISAIGVVMIFIPSDDYGLFLVGRVVYGLGFGFNVPALGSAFMKWFRPKGRQIMVTLNGVLPLLGALVTYVTFPVIADIAGGDGGLDAGWQMGYGFTGFIVFAVFVIWIVGVRKKADAINIAAEEERILGVEEPSSDDKQGSAFKWAIGTNQIKCIIVCFICDFCMYMYIATILPIWLINAGSMDEITANFWTAIAFPLFGVIGTVLGGIIMNVTGRRKIIIVLCQIIKLAGFIIACLGADSNAMFIIVGVALFGIGNGGWMPPMFLMPTEIKGTSSTRVAASYAIFMSCGYAAGLVSPVIGGIMSTEMIASSGIQGEAAQLAYGLKWSVFYLGLSHVISIIVALRLKETGPNARFE